MSALLDQMRSLYARAPSGGSLEHAPIEPFVGRAFTDPQPDDLRFVMVGVNAYVDDVEWARAKPSPAWFKSWFAEGKHRFYPRVAKDARELADGLASAPLFRGKCWREKEGIYLTNFVKTYVRTSLGKREDQVGHELAFWSDHWAEELDVLAGHDTSRT